MREVEFAAGVPGLQVVPGARGRLCRCWFLAMAASLALWSAACGQQQLVPPPYDGGTPDSGAQERDACVPVSCSELGMNCGTLDDGCGQSLTCGSCTGEDQCGGAGIPNQCGTCAAEVQRGLICNGACWCWENPRPFGNDLLSVWGATEDDVWAVGLITTLHWNGTRWHALPPDLRNSLNLVWGKAADDVWVLGPSALHWDGRTWSTLPAMEGSLGATSAVWEATPGDVWFGAYGSLQSGRYQVAHWDGQRWSYSSLDPSGVCEVSSMFGFSATDVWALALYCQSAIWRYGDIGYGLLGWKAVPSSLSLNFGDRFQLAATGPNALWAATPDSVQFWDGGAWTDTGFGGNSVAVAPRGDVWVAGARGIGHWTGIGWTVTDAGTASLEGIWVGGTSGWAVGLAGEVWSLGDGGWNRQTTGDRPDFVGLWGAAPDDIWASATGGKLYHYDGRSWRLHTTLPLEVKGVWGAGSSDVWVAATGAMFHWDGRAWSVGAGSVGSSNTAVWGVEGTDVWAVGSGPDALHWNGTTWVAIPTVGLGELRAVWGASRNDVWAAGGGQAIDQNGRVLHWDGASWAQVYPLPPFPRRGPTAPSFRAIWGTGSSDVWFLGLTGAVRWNGTTWGPEEPVAGQAAWTDPTGHAWVAPGLQEFKRGRWYSQATGVQPELTAIWGSSARDVWAVGRAGTILHLSY